MSPEPAPNFPPKDQRVQRFATVATVAFAAFILGFVPMWLTARTRGVERDAAGQRLRIVETENTLAAAALQARRGEYEAARVSASDFYTRLQSELERPDSGFAAPAGDTLRAVLEERDQIITLLARGDAAGAERLAAAYVTYRQAAGDPTGPR